MIRLLRCGFQSGADPDRRAFFRMSPSSTAVGAAEFTGAIDG
jgi:hypothetical protein